jgi:hypothetical protein
MRAAAGLIVLVAASVPVEAGVVDSPQCQRDLAATHAGLEDTLARLKRVSNAPLKDKCAALHWHVGVMRKAGAVFARCTTGHERGENVGQMKGSVADFLDIIRQLCGGQ